MPVIIRGIDFNTKRPGRQRDKDDMRSSCFHEFLDRTEAPACWIEVHVVVKDGESGHG